MITTPSSRRRMLAWACACLMAVVAAASATGAQPVAMVTDLDGTASGVDGSTIHLLAELRSGGRITLPAGSTMVLVYFAGGTEYSFAGPAEVEVGDAAPITLSGAAPASRTVLGAGGPTQRISPSGKAQASVAMRAVGHEMEITLLGPAPGGILLEQRPTFRWLPVEGAARYRIELIDEDLDKVIEATLDIPRYELPDEIVLVRGGLYTCHLETRLPDGTPLSTWAVFTVATDEQLRLVESLRPVPEAEFSDQLIFALWLRQRRFTDEARRLWPQLRAQRPSLETWPEGSP
jgi:hypothetical protein